MKTPLSEKLTQMTKYQSGSNLFETKEALNQLIDYLAELTTVVEGNKKKKHYTEEDVEIIVEQIMQEISDVFYTEPILLTELRKREKEMWVDAIVNRLMP